MNESPAAREAVTVPRAARSASQNRPSSTTRVNPSRAGGAQGKGLTAHNGAAAAGDKTVNGKDTVLTDAAAAGVDALRDSTTGLLARHLAGPLLTQPPSITSARPAARKDGAGGSSATANAELNATVNFLKALPADTRRRYDAAAVAESARQQQQQQQRCRTNRQRSREHGTAHPRHGHRSLLDSGDVSADGASDSQLKGLPQGPPTAALDDRITAQTLHMLLGKSRTVAERLLPPSLSLLGQQQRYYTFSTAAEQRAEREAELNNPLLGKSKALGSSLAQRNAAVKHQEPPEVQTLSQSARYYYPTNADGKAATTTGTGTSASAVSEVASYHARRPSTAAALLQYPPIPVQYASIDAKKQALTRKRLGLSAVTPAPTATASTAATAGAREGGAKAHSGGTGGKAAKAARAGDEGTAKTSARGNGSRDALPDIHAGSAIAVARRDDSVNADTDPLSVQQREWVLAHGAEDFDAVDVPLSRRGDSNGTPHNVALQFALTAAATRGDDTSLIQQLVKLYGSERFAAPICRSSEDAKVNALTVKSLQAAGQSSSTRQRQRPQARSKAPVGNSEAGLGPAFPMLDAILSVSREFDQIRAKGSAAADTAQERQGVVARLTSLASTQIPEQYWVTVQRKTALSSRTDTRTTKPKGRGGDRDSPGREEGDASRISARSRSPQPLRLSETAAHLADGDGLGNGGTQAFTVVVPAAAVEEGSDGEDHASTGITADDDCDVVADRAGRHRVTETSTEPFQGDWGDLETLSGSCSTFDCGVGDGRGAGTSRASCEPQLDRCASARESNEREGITQEGLVVFPAPRPVGRAQVYLLAETLDHMLNADPAWLRAVADREIAYAILPPASTAAALGRSTPQPCQYLPPTCDEEHANPLIDPELQWRSRHAYELYTRASGHVLRVLDVGLVELVRQVSAQCVERGALLDTLRQMVVDIAESHVRVLAHAKERAFEEATARVAIREELTTLQAQLDAATDTIQSLHGQLKEADAAKVGLAEKAARLDDLVARVEAKRRHHEVHSEDAHVCVLRELEKQMAQSASVALNSIFEERCRLAGLNASSGSSSNSSEHDDDDDGDNEGNSCSSGGSGADRHDEQSRSSSGSSRDSDEEGLKDLDDVATLPRGEGESADNALRLPTGVPQRAVQLKRRRKKKKQNAATHTNVADPLTGAASATVGALEALSVATAAAAAADKPRKPARIAEAPSAQHARMRAAESQKAAGTLYQQAHQLLRTLHEATEAMNAAAAPLYDGVVLKSVSSAANVATARWASVARAVGRFEKEKSHRQRVFAVFCAWCDRYQRVRLKEPRSTAEQSAPRDDEGENDDSRPIFSPTALRARALGRDAPAHHSGRGGDFVVDSSSSDRDDSDAGGGRRRGGKRVDSLCDESAASFMSLPSAGQSMREEAAQAIAEVKKDNKEVEQLTENTRSLREIQYITPGDLVDMDVRDCSADEVNMLFANGFDFRAYLHPVWRERSQQQQQQGHEEEEPVGSTNAEGGATSPSARSLGDWTLTLSDVAQMVQDVQTTLREMTLRMRAMAESAILRKGVQPPLQPPQRPQDPCPLCARRDTVTEEKQRRQRALRQVAKDVQSRLESLGDKCQRAEAEREDARGEARRLQAEVQQLRQQLQQQQQQLQQQQQQQQQQQEETAGHGSRRRGSLNNAPSPSSAGSSPSLAAPQPRGIIKRRASLVSGNTAGQPSASTRGAGHPSSAFAKAASATPKTTRKHKIAMVSSPPQASLGEESGPPKSLSPSSHRRSSLSSTKTSELGSMSHTRGPILSNSCTVVEGDNASALETSEGEVVRRSPSPATTPTGGRGAEDDGVDQGVNRRGTLPPSALLSSPRLL